MTPWHSDVFGIVSVHLALLSHSPPTICSTVIVDSWLPSWPESMLCTIFSTIWVCCHNLTICSQFGLISRDLGAVRCGSLVLSWLENKFFGNENFIEKNTVFSTLIFVSRIFSFPPQFFQKHRGFLIKISILRVKNV